MGIGELLKREELRRFAKLVEIPEAKDIYRFLSRFSEEQFIGFVLGVLSSICLKRGRNRVLIVDSTDVSLDLNWFRKKITKADLAGKEFKWGYSSLVKRLLYRLQTHLSHRIPFFETCCFSASSGIAR